MKYPFSRPRSVPIPVLPQSINSWATCSHGMPQAGAFVTPANPCPKDGRIRPRTPASAAYPFPVAVTHRAPAEAHLRQTVTHE
ncbi:MAG: hypothetical protein QG597_4686 [Actinomycetota bacterium]|nr:hypothetical protein [Actinomycetota bacterium]